MMARRPHGLVLDSWAVLAYLQGESAAEKMSEIIADALEHGTPLYVSVVNAGEIWYIMARELSASHADAAISDVRSWGVQFVDADWELAQRTAVFKSKHKMSYADAFAAALAQGRKAELVTGDPELKRLELEIRIKWLGADN